MTTTLARHGAAKPRRAGRCSGCCKLKPAHQPNQVSSVFFLLDWPFIDVSWRASRALASARGLPRRRRARAVGRVLSGQKWFQPKGCPTAALRGARVARRLPRNAAVLELGGSGCAGCPPPPKAADLAVLGLPMRRAAPRDGRGCRTAACMVADDAHQRSVNGWGACDDVRRAAAALAAANAPRCTTLRT